MLKKIRTAVSVIILSFLISSIAVARPIDDCSEYLKLGIPGQQGDLVCRKGHLLAHSPQSKTPIWVIEHLTAEKAASDLVPRYNRFSPDPDLKKGERAELADYKGSGYDRGHMAPAADMRWDRQAMKECFYLSNIVPQVGKGMNQGIWKDLEEYVRKWAIERGEVYVFTGPIYDVVFKKIGKNRVAVPSQLYKIIYDPYKAEAIAFIMPNEKLASKDMPNYIVTIRDIESKTGLDFLSNLDSQVQVVIETKRAERLW